MRNRFYTVLAVGVAAAAFGFAAPATAQPYGPGYGPGYGMMGGYGPGYGMGPGMMGGYGPGYGMGPGMMGPGYGPGMMGGYGRGYGPGMMGGYGPGYGPGYARDLNLSTDNVKDYLERTMRNRNLKVGEVKEKDDDTIVAEIVTKDKDALVQRLEVNRHNGYFQPVQ